jgi:hypothetical protein
MPLDNTTPRLWDMPEPEPEFRVWGASGEKISFECRKFPDGRLGVCTFVNESKDAVPVLILTPEAAASLLAYLVGGSLH